jgi:hypothetical protein
MKKIGLVVMVLAMAASAFVFGKHTAQAVPVTAVVPVCPIAGWTLNKTTCGCVAPPMASSVAQ